MADKIEKYLFYLLLFSIPFQIRKIFWYPGWLFNEWQAASLYLTDILLAGLFLFWIFNARKKIAGFRFGNLNIRTVLSDPNTWLIVLIIVSGISIKNSSNYPVSWYYFAKIIEFTLFYFYLSGYAFRKFGLINSFSAIFVGGFFQAVIAIAQFFNQASIGLKYLGESILDHEIIGIASFYLSDGDKIIRAYGTMPHPNVLAGYLFLSLFSFYFLYLYFRFNGNRPAFSFDRYWGAFPVVVLFAFFTTFSRVVIFAWFMSFVLRSAAGLLSRNYRSELGRSENKKRITVILLTSLAVIVLFGIVYSDAIFNRLSIGEDDLAVKERLFYAEEAVKTELSLFGVGTGNFVGSLIEREPFLLRYIYQPVHNIYLLVYAETGLLGILAFMLFLILAMGGYIRDTGLKKFSQFSYLVFVLSLLFIGFFDHFLWTLQQGRFIFWFSMAGLTYISKSDIIS